MFRIKQYGELSGWRPIAMDMPLVQQNHCPCCTTELETACALVGEHSIIEVTHVGSVYKEFARVGGVRVRVGSCPKCGYLGYIDRPTEQWFKDFYAQDWDGQGQRDLEATAEKIRTNYQRLDSNVELVKQSGVGIDEDILEIGSGYGCAIQQLKDAGYKNVYGVEPCSHRRDLMRQVFGGIVWDSSDKAGGGTGYGLVYSSHVLEHCYDPNEMIQTAARLQDRGGLLSICVPRQEAEPTMGVLLFLPHLHSFTECSLVNLLNKHGYATMDLRRDEQSIYLLAIKTGRQLGVPQGESKGVEKIRTALLGLNGDSSPSSRFWWNYLNDRCGYVPDASEWEFFTRQLQRPRFVYVEPCGKSTPCEVQFEGPLRLCVK